MSSYSADPVPTELDAVTAEYLNRQFNAITVAMTPEGKVIVPKSGIVPLRPIEGGIVYVPNDGMYACVKTEADGVAEWLKIAPTEAGEPIEPPDPIEPPEVNLSGKTWNDFQ
jgi:hypothetical protein